MAAPTYKLDWAYKAAHTFQSSNFFLFHDYARAWLDASQKVVDLCNKVHGAWMAAQADEMFVDQKVSDLAGPVRDRLRDLIVMSAAAKAGYLHHVPCSMVSGVECVPTGLKGRQAYAGGIPFANEDAVKAWSEEYQKETEEIAKPVIRDMALAFVLRDGVRRRRLKLQHDMKVLESSIYGRLFVPAKKVKDYIRDLVFRGLWGSSDPNQDIFNRYVKVFVGDMRWSSYTASIAADIASIRAEFQYLSDQQGQSGLLEIVEQAMQWGGGVAA